MKVKITDIEKAMGRKASKRTPWFDEETGQRMGFTLHFDLKDKPERGRSKRKPEKTKTPAP